MSGFDVGGLLHAWAENSKVFKSGPGAIGRIALLGAVFFACLVGVAFAPDTPIRYLILELAAGALVLCVLAILSVLIFFPKHALMEGAELRDIYLSSTGMKEAPFLTPTPVVSNPERPEPRSLPGETA